MIQQSKQKIQYKACTDYSLLLKRIEKAVLHDQKNPSCENILENKKIWIRLEPDQKLKWASLAQIAGIMDTAIEIYKDLTENVPEYHQAWLDYLELLSILDRRREFASVLVRAKKYIDADDLKNCGSVLHTENFINSESSGSPGNIKSRDNNSEFKDITMPFESMIWKRTLMEWYLKLFSGREDIFARQWFDKTEQKSGYVPVRHAMDINDIEDHLHGKKTYGIYLLNSDSMVNLGVIDADIISSFRTGKLSNDKKKIIKREKLYLISRIKEASHSLNLNPVVEFSGYKGYHFWYFFAEPVEAARVKSILKNIADPIDHDLMSFDLEVFPKQDSLTGKGLGNLVKLPLGIHRVTRKLSFFMECSSRDINSQLGFLKKIIPASPKVLNGAAKTQNTENIIIHPKIAGYAKDYPELFSLEQACPPLGGLIASARKKGNMGVREEKILFQTLGFLPRGHTLIHYLMAFGQEYNPHLVDFRLSRLRGSPLGCRRIHSLLGFTGDFCNLDLKGHTYQHPLLHLAEWIKCREKKSHISGKIKNLQDALENMKTAIIQVQKFMG